MHIGILKFIIYKQQMLPSEGWLLLLLKKKKKTTTTYIRITIYNVKLTVLFIIKLFAGGRIYMVNEIKRHRMIHANWRSLVSMTKSHRRNLSIVLLQNNNKIWTENYIAKNAHLAYSCAAGTNSIIDRKSFTQKNRGHNAYIATMYNGNYGALYA